MFAVVGKQRQVVTQGARSDHEIEIADDFLLGAKPSPLPSEDLAGLLVDADDGNAPEEIFQVPFVAFGIAGIVDALVEFGDGNQRQRESALLQFLKLRDDL